MSKLVQWIPGSLGGWLECMRIQREAANCLLSLEVWTSIPCSPDLPPWPFQIQDLKLLYSGGTESEGVWLCPIWQDEPPYRESHGCHVSAEGSVVAKQNFKTPWFHVTSLLLVAKQIAQVLLCGHLGLWLGKGSFLLCCNLERVWEIAVSVLVDDV